MTIFLLKSRNKGIVRHNIDTLSFRILYLFMVNECEGSEIYRHFSYHGLVLGFPHYKGFIILSVLSGL